MERPQEEEEDEINFNRRETATMKQIKKLLKSNEPDWKREDQKRSRHLPYHACAAKHLLSLAVAPSLYYESRYQAGAICALPHQPCAHFHLPLLPHLDLIQARRLVHSPLQLLALPLLLHQPHSPHHLHHLLLQVPAPRNNLHHDYHRLRARFPLLPRRPPHQEPVLPGQRLLVEGHPDFHVVGDPGEPDLRRLHLDGSVPLVFRVLPRALHGALGMSDDAIPPAGELLLQQLLLGPTLLRQ